MIILFNDKFDLVYYTLVNYKLILNNNIMNKLNILNISIIYNVIQYIFLCKG